MKTFARIALPLALLIAAPLQAQTTIGVKGGINIATVDTNVEDIEDLVESKTGFVGGAFVTFGLGNIFAVQPELLYSQKGFQGDEFDETVKVNTNYIEIPVLLKAQLKLAMLRPAIYAGPVVSFETGCDISASGLSVDCDVGEEGFINRKKTDWAAVFGANLDFFLGPVTLIVDGRYQLGLTNLADDPDFPEEDVKNRVWQFMAGIGWTL
jgi:hypothetical protein